MRRRAAQPREQRIVVLAMVLAVHAAFFVLLLQHTTQMPPDIKSTIVSVIAINAERPSAAKPPPPTLPAKVADTFMPVTALSIPDAVQSDAPAGATGACSAPDAVLEALLRDPAALDAIGRSPPETRSVAQAVVMWNEAWSPFALDAAAPLGPVRATIERTLASLDDACLDEPVTGPRLLPVPDETGQGTILIALGSGVWTWRALIVPPPPSPAAGAMPLTATPSAQ